MAKINLLPGSVKKIRGVNQQVEALVWISRGLLVVFVLVVIVIFGWTFFVSQEIENWNRREATMTEELALLAPDEVLYRRFLTVAAAADQILNRRRDFQAIIEEIYSLVPTGAFVEDLQFVERGVLVRINADNVHVFVATIEGFSSITENSLFSEIVISTISRVLDGRYVFTLELGIRNTNGS